VCRCRRIFAPKTSTASDLRSGFLAPAPPSWPGLFFWPRRSCNGERRRPAQESEIASLRRAARPVEGYCAQHRRHRGGVMARRRSADCRGARSPRGSGPPHGMRLPQDGPNRPQRRGPHRRLTATVAGLVWRELGYLSAVPTLPRLGFSPRAALIFKKKPT
jgi:hypothetical protein